MSAAIDLAAEMTRRWALDGGGEDAVVCGTGATLVRWRHRLDELPRADMPAHAVIFLRSATRSVRRRGRREDVAPAIRRNVGVVAAGDCGHWTFPDAAASVCDVTHLYLPPAYLEALADGNGGTPVEVRDALSHDDPGLRTLMPELDAALDHAAPDRLYVECLAAAVAARLIGLQRPGAWRATGGLAPWQVKRACEALAVPRGEMGLQALAEMVGLSPAHFSRAFRRSTGVSPSRWRAERQVERAKALLTDKESSLAEVALASGFAAQPQFTTAFRRATGTTPGAWRRERGG